MRYLWLAGLVALMSGCVAAPMESDGGVPELSGACDRIAQYDFAFPRFDETAQQLAHATGCFIETDLSQTAAIGVNPVKGQMSIRQALAVAIKDTPLKIVKQEPNLISVSVSGEPKK
ncbi:hypothetical protein [Vibrio porteresiae]|uniref:Lipoprotein n=1 Tax=Vibrio porteresiae DSM 19223 TaxID=1123496 RepID=A0ABZ0QLF8_9VIBR|nr:hypothetical protein [Vibrio porteresiae]WPC76881.1 hypothetical protein R8Z52_20355 [Vibrio porteresiae DSM 19223]